MRWALILLVAAACSAGAPPLPQAPPREGIVTEDEPPPPFAPSIATPAVPADHPLHAEALPVDACFDDAACVVEGGAGELCRSRTDPGGATSQTARPRDARCGCVGGLCVWYRLEGTRRQRLSR
jgi:hypothetical protein